MKRKKILFMSSWYPTNENPTHGIFVKRHAEAISLFHDVYVLYAAGRDYAYFEEIKKISGSLTEHIFYFDRRNKNGFQKYIIKKKIYSTAFIKIISDWGMPDIIHLNVIYPEGIFAAAFAKKYKIPLIITEHWTGYLPEDGNYSGLIKKYFTKKVLSEAKVICPVTEQLAKKMLQQGLRGNYEIVPNVVDTDFFVPTENFKNDNITLMHLSSLDERQKNPQTVIDAFLQVQREMPGIKLIFAGDGENFYHLKNANQNDSIEYVFQPMGEELLSLYQYCDAFVLCSRYENLPVVLLEAMSCGKPVISSCVGGIPEYINNSTGILFEPADVTNLVSAIRCFIKIKDNFDSQQIRNSAIKNFSKISVAKKYDNIYSALA